MKNLLNCKKAQGKNYLSIIIVIISFVIVSMIAYVIYDKFVLLFNASGFSNSVTDKVISGFTAGLNMLDIVAVFIMVILIIGVGLSSYKLNTAPVFFWVSFIMGAFYGLGSYFFNYIFSSMVSQPIFLTVITHFPLSMIICTNLHWVMLVSWAIGSITLYSNSGEPM